MKAKITEYRVTMGIAIGLIPAVLMFVLLYFSGVISRPFSEASYYEPFALLVICLALVSIALSSYAGSLTEKHKM